MKVKTYLYLISKKNKMKLNGMKWINYIRNIRIIMKHNQMKVWKILN